MMLMEITLLQALTGVDFVHTHLDGTKIRIKNNPGDVIKPDSIMTIEDKGLPFYRKSYTNGNLYIKFSVSFPNKMNAPELKLLHATIGAEKPDTEMTDSTIEVAKLKGYDEKLRNTQPHGGQDAENSDEEDEDPRGGQRVQCAQ
jgi:DnaJ-class molecular chaperone